MTTCISQCKSGSGEGQLFSLFFLFCTIAYFSIPLSCFSFIGLLRTNAVTVFLFSFFFLFFSFRRFPLWCGVLSSGLHSLGRLHQKRAGVLKSVHWDKQSICIQVFAQRRRLGGVAVLVGYSLRGSRVRQHPPWTLGRQAGRKRALVLFSWLNVSGLCRCFCRNSNDCQRG